MLDGLPNLQDLGKLLIGENVPELLSCDLQSETGAQATIKDAHRVLRERCATTSRATSCKASSMTPRSTSTARDPDRPARQGRPRELPAIADRRPPTDACHAPESPAMIVCVCRRVSDHDIHRAAARRARSASSACSSSSAWRCSAAAAPTAPRASCATRARRRPPACRCCACTRPSRRPRVATRATSLRSAPYNPDPFPSRSPPPRGVGRHARHLALAQGPARRSSPASRRASRRSLSSTSPRFSALEAERKALQTRTEELQARRNSLSREIGKLKGQGGDASAAMAEVGGIGAELERSAERLAAIQAELHEHADVAAEPAATRAFRSAPTSTPTSRCGAGARRAAFEFAPRDHVDVGAPLGLDLETGAKLSGSRFSFLRGPVARLHRALAQFMLDVQTQEHGYTECYTPYIVNREVLEGTGQLPKFKDDMFWVFRGAERRGEAGAAREQYLISTSEISLTNSVRGELLAEASAADPADRAHAVLSLRGGQRRPRHARHDPPAPVRQGRDGADHASRRRATRRSTRWSAMPRRSCRSSSLPYRVVLLSHRRHGLRRDQDLRPRGLGAGAEHLSRDQLGARTARRSRRGACRRASRPRRARTSSCTPSTARASRSAARWSRCSRTARTRDGSVTVPAALRPYLGGAGRAAPPGTRRESEVAQRDGSADRGARRARELLAALDDASTCHLHRRRSVVRPGRGLRRRRRDPAPAHRARREAARLQDRLHQPRHLGALRRLRADLGPGLGHDRRARRQRRRRTCRWRRSREPRLEPEIMFGFARAPRAGHEPGRARRLHRLGRARLRDRPHALRRLALRRRRHGRRLRPARPPLRRPARADRRFVPTPARELAALRVTLSCDGRDVEEGGADIVLDGPLTRAPALGRCDGRAGPSAGRSSPATSSRPAPSPTRRRCARAQRWQTRLSDPRLAGLTLTHEA